MLLPGNLNNLDPWTSLKKIAQPRASSGRRSGWRRAPKSGSRLLPLIGQPLDAGHQLDRLLAIFYALPPSCSTGSHFERGLRLEASEAPHHLLNTRSWKQGLGMLFPLQTVYRYDYCTTVEHWVPVTHETGSLLLKTTFSRNVPELATARMNMANWRAPVHRISLPE